MVEHEAYEKLVGAIVGNYRLEQLREKHKWGPIFLGQTKTGERYDIRFLDIQGRANAADERIMYLGRFQQEANRVAALHHPHILPLLDYGNYQGLPYLVYPAIALVTLRSLLAKSVPTDLVAVGRYLEQIAEALEYAHHQAVIHRGLASDCIYMQSRQQLLVADFGLLRIRELIRQDRQGAAIEPGRRSETSTSYEGSSETSAPEQLLGKPIDASADTYALGAVLYRLLTGQPPFIGKSRDEVVRQHLYAQVPSLRKWRVELPGELDQVIARAMAKEPLQRFHRPGELVMAYYRVVAPQELPRLSSAFSSGASGYLPVASRDLRHSGSLVASSTAKPQKTGVSRRQLMRILAVSGGIGVVALAALYGEHLLQPHASSLQAAHPGQNQGTAQHTTTGQTANAGTAQSAPAHQGTVLAHTTDLPLNSAKTFPLPNHQHPGVLIHLPDNRFVAFDSTCTHAQCAVSYNQKNSLLECPCHGAVFNPARNAAVIQGPAPTPLAPVQILVHTDGTITTG